MTTLMTILTIPDAITLLRIAINEAEHISNNEVQGIIRLELYDVTTCSLTPKGKAHVAQLLNTPIPNEKIIYEDVYGTVIKIPEDN